MYLPAADMCPKVRISSENTYKVKKKKGKKKLLIMAKHNTGILGVTPLSATKQHLTTVKRRKTIENEMAR